MTILSQIRLHLGMVLVTFVAFLTMVGVNEVLFRTVEFIPGINWVYLPAGVRLLATLLFGLSGAIGLLLASWCASFWIFFPDDFPRAFVGGIIAAVAPYIVYVMARRFFGLRGSLANLTAGKLLICIVGYSVASPLMHHIWFHLRDPVGHDWSGFFVMATGDFLGSVVVFYTIKLALNRWMPPRAAGTPHPR
jgi:hypothetical protein